MTLEFKRHLPIISDKKLGRNQRCHCGSGKKYKHCCLSKDESERPTEQKELVGKIVKWMYDQKFVVDLMENILNNIFHDRMFEKEAINALIEALIFEGLHKNKRMIDHFILKANLTENEKAVYRRWRDESVFSFFEVLEVKYGKSIKFRDLANNQEYFVYERSGTYQIDPGDIIAQRLLPRDDTWMIAGGLGMVMSDKEHGNIFKKEFSRVIGNMSEHMFVEAHYSRR